MPLKFSWNFLCRRLSFIGGSGFNLSLRTDDVYVAISHFTFQSPDIKKDLKK